MKEGLLETAVLDVGREAGPGHKLPSFWVQDLEPKWPLVPFSRLGEAE